MGCLDFVASAVIAGADNEYRVPLEYDSACGLSIVDNPQRLGERGYFTSEQSMAFFIEADAAREADRFARCLVAGADWRSRSKL
jgi:hypothetical protein